MLLTQWVLLVLPLRASFQSAKSFLQNRESLQCTSTCLVWVDSYPQASPLSLATTLLCTYSGSFMSTRESLQTRRDHGHCRGDSLLKSLTCRYEAPTRENTVYLCESLSSWEMVRK